MQVTDSTILNEILLKTKNNEITPKKTFLYNIQHSSVFDELNF